MINKTSMFCVLLGAVVACSNAPDNDTPQPPSTTESDGDVRPTTLVPLPPANVRGPMVQWSGPGSFKIDVPKQDGPYVAVSRDVMIIIPPGQVAQDVAVPVDAPEGAWLYIGPRTTDKQRTRAAVADIQAKTPQNTALSLATTRQVSELPGMQELMAKKRATARPRSAFALSGQKAGTYTVSIGPVAAEAGVTINVVQPNASLALRAQPNRSMHLLGGDRLSVRVDILDGSTAKTGKVHGYLIYPNGSKIVEVPVTATSDGSYEAVIAGQLDANSPIGGYSVRVVAEADDGSWQRVATTGFRYGVPTARITSVGSVREVLADGQVAALDVDVNVEVASKDRYEVSAVLAGKLDGATKVAAAAQTAAVLDAGSHTLTLRFKSGYLKLSEVTGALDLRQLTLFSQGRNTLLQRADLGFGVRYANLDPARMAPLRQVLPGVREMYNQGYFPNAPAMQDEHDHNEEPDQPYPH